MKPFIPTRVYYEPAVEKYEQGRMLLSHYGAMKIPLIPIESHHRIEELRKRPNKEYLQMKHYLILGIRKTMKLVPNDKSADYIVPFTSSGCTAMCLYCYLVRKNIKKVQEHRVYELGSNSDMVLENTITGNLRWAIEEFGKLEDATATFATKFAAVDSLLTARHNGHTQMRLSVNPQPLISRVEFGTSSLEERIQAANKMFEAGYRVGLNVAPIMLVENWQTLYEELFKTLSEKLSSGVKKQLFIEVIFMTYAMPNYYINTESMPNAINLLDKERMRPKGLGKYCYRPEWRNPAEAYIRVLIEKYLPDAWISYMV